MMISVFFVFFRKPLRWSGNDDRYYYSLHGDDFLYRCQQGVIFTMCLFLNNLYLGHIKREGIPMLYFCYITRKLPIKNTINSCL